MILSYIVYCIVFFTSVVTVRRWRCAYAAYRLPRTVWVSRVLLDSVARRTADATGVMLRVAAPVSCVRAVCIPYTLCITVEWKQSAPKLPSYQARSVGGTEHCAKHRLHRTQQVHAGKQRTSERPP